MKKYPCPTCVNRGRCNRTVGKQGDDYKCGDYDPVRCCSNCVRDGKQLVERKCLHCSGGGLISQYVNFELRT